MSNPRSQVSPYFVDFTGAPANQGNSIDPASNILGYGPMKLGMSSANINAEKFWQRGLNLSVFRTAGPTSLASNTVYVVPPKPIPIASRILMRLEFERPFAQVAYHQQPPDPRTHLPNGGAVSQDEKFQPPEQPQAAGEPWGVALNVKVGNENDVAGEGRVGASCQFRLTGVRLNAPGAVEKAYFQTLPDLISPYQDYWTYAPSNGAAVLFALEFDFLGFGVATGGPAVGRATLSADGKTDARVFSHTGLAGNSDITALGAAVVTLDGVGQVMARLLNFSLHVETPNP